MNLEFNKVNEKDKFKIENIYDILKINGEHMFLQEGLIHWKSAYPIELITENCLKKEVFIVKDLDNDLFIHTFQLEFKKLNLASYFGTQIGENFENFQSVGAISKFATLPEFHGKGVGRHSFNFIENYCKMQNVNFLILDVYSKSTKAVQFYLNRGFKVMRTVPTKFFSVYEMFKPI